MGAVSARSDCSSSASSRTAHNSATVRSYCSSPSTLAEAHKWHSFRKCHGCMGRFCNVTNYSQHDWLGVTHCTTQQNSSHLNLVTSTKQMWHSHWSYKLKGQEPQPLISCCKRRCQHAGSFAHVHLCSASKTETLGVVKATRSCCPREVNFPPDLKHASFSAQVNLQKHPQGSGTSLPPCRMPLLQPKQSWPKQTSAWRLAAHLLQTRSPLNRTHQSLVVQTKMQSDGSHMLQLVLAAQPQRGEEKMGKGQSENTEMIWNIWKTALSC